MHSPPGVVNVVFPENARLDNCLVSYTIAFRNHEILEQRCFRSSSVLYREFLEIIHRRGIRSSSILYSEYLEIIE